MSEFPGLRRTGTIYEAPTGGPRRSGSIYEPAGGLQRSGTMFGPGLQRTGGPGSQRGSVYAPSATAMFSNNAIGPVDLQSTIEEFGVRDFDTREYVVDNFNRFGIHKAAAFKVTLEERKQLSSNALKQFVTDNYRKFIDTSKEISLVEGDMVNLNNMLNEYGAVLKGLMEINLDGSKTQDSNSQSAQKDEQKIVVSKQVEDDVSALAELAEELGGLIYERKLEQAVSMIESAYERIEELDAKAVRTVRAQVDTSVTQLVDLLAADLQSASIKSGERRRVAQYLIRLGFADRALNIFLRHRSQSIKSDIRSIKFQGDLSVYVSELSSVVCTAIAAACADFRRLFSDRDMMSGFVVWAVAELESFASIFQRQVFAQDTPIAKMAECLKLAFNACRSLDSLGLRLSFVLTRSFAPFVAASVQKVFDSMDHELMEIVNVDGWVTAELWVRVQKPATASKEPGAKDKPAQRAVKLTESAKLLYDLVHRLISDIKLLVSSSSQLATDLYSPVVQGAVRMFEKYLLKMTEVARKLDVTHAAAAGTECDAQQLAMVANTFYLGDDLLPRVCRHFEKQFERPVPELDQFANKLMRLYRALSEQVCKRRAPYWVVDVWQWPCQDLYAAASIDQNTAIAAPSRACQRVVFFVAHMRKLVLDCLPGESLELIISKAIEELFAQLADDERYWERVTIGLGGLQQLTLDVRTILAATEQFLTDSVLAAADALLDRATQLYSASNSGDTQFKDAWFDVIVAQRLPPSLRLLPAPAESENATPLP